MEENKKLYKPKGCAKCPAVKIEKGMLICLCMKELKANINNSDEKLEMWEKCPLAWDKE